MPPKFNPKLEPKISSLDKKIDLETTKSLYKKFSDLSPEDQADVIKHRISETGEEMDALEIPLDSKRGYEQEKIQFLNLIEDFKNKHSIEKLNTITNLSAELTWIFANFTNKEIPEADREIAFNKLNEEDKETFKIRFTAINDLKPITNLLKIMLEETNITKAEYDELVLVYKIPYSRAIGIISNGVVDHTR